MQGLDIFLGELPSAPGSPLAPLDFGPSPSSGMSSLDFDLPDAMAPLDLGGDAAGSMSPLDLGLEAGGAAVGAPPSMPGDEELLGTSQGPVDIGSMLDSMLSGTAPPPAAAAGSAPAAVSPAARAPAPAAAMRPLAQTSGGFMPELPASSPAPWSGDIPAPSTGFGLTLEEGDTAPEPSPAGARPQVVIPTAPQRAHDSNGEALPAGVQWMEAPKRRAANIEDDVIPGSRRKLLLLGGAAALAIAGGAAFFIMRAGGAGGSAEGILAPFKADLARDHYPAYAAGADALTAGADEDDVAQHARAAELLLTSVLARGAERTKLTRAEELLAKVPSAGELSPEVSRARALLAVAKARGAEVETLLGPAASTPEGQLITGLRRLRERKLPQALTALKVAATAPGQLLPVYLLARAQEDSGQLVEARASYRKVVAGNAEHAGALVALARLEAQPPAGRLEAAQALVTKVTPSASPPELGEAKALTGEAFLVLGRTAEAVATLTRAATASPQSVAVQMALAEALVADGRAAEALGRLRALEPSMLASTRGRLAMGAALVAGGQVADGRLQLASVAQEAAQNPRLPYWMGVAAESQRPTDEAGAEAGYRQALALDPRFLPASLRLAALLQRQGKADAAMAVIDHAQKAGAPQEALELAFGQALIEAKNPTQAIAVFRQAVARAPQMAPARVGLASALEASGDLAAAAAELSTAITELKGGGGLRERLADLLIRQGKKDAALAQLEAEATAEPGNRGVRVRLAKLALDLGRADRAQKEAAAVVAEDPTNPEALFTLAQAREAQGELGAALADYKRATSFGTSPELHLAYGKALAASGRDDEALGQLTAAGERAVARLERARIRLRRGDMNEALQDAEAAAQVEPNNAVAHFVRGQCLDLLGRADEAAGAWRDALKADPNLAEAHYRLGRYEMDKGRQTQALVHFRQAAALNPKETPWLADLLFQLGFAEAASGSKGNAATALKRYLDVAPRDAPARPEAERQLARMAKR